MRVTGEKHAPEYMGHTWFLVSTGASEQASMLFKSIDIAGFEFNGRSRLVDKNNIKYICPLTCNLFCVSVKAQLMFLGNMLSPELEHKTRRCED